jgi:hypothetical protein
MKFTHSFSLSLSLSLSLCKEPSQFNSRLQRVKLFVQIFTSTILGNVNNTNVQSKSDTAFLILVREVQKALSKEENFSTKTQIRPQSMAHSIKFLLKPFKFRLIRGSYSHLAIFSHHFFVCSTFFYSIFLLIWFIFFHRSWTSCNGRHRLFETTSIFSY